MKWLIEKYIQYKWDKKSDDQILFAYQDTKDWLAINYVWLEGDVLEEIHRSCQERLDQYILPQIKKRGLKI